jgi:hypothetical protein
MARAEPEGFHMDMEAQSVIALRMLRLATGGARMEAEDEPRGDQ